MVSPSTIRPRALWLVLLALAGCGGFVNEPLTLGTVRGRLSELDSSALVAAVAAPEAKALTRRAVLHPDGSFELAEVPPGDYTFFVVATAEKVLRVRATVRAGGISDLGTLAPKQGAFIQVRLSQPSLAKTALVTALGTPYANRKFELSSAQLAIGPLPEGCYDVVATANGTEHRWNSCVLEGERLNETVCFRAPPSGCRAPGASCPAGLVCASDGSCVACLEGSDCADGLTCHERSCVGSPIACASCRSDDQCGAGNWCVALDDSHAVCILPCSSGGTCDAGFECHYGFCIPDSHETCEKED